MTTTETRSLIQILALNKLFSLAAPRKPAGNVPPDETAQADQKVVNFVNGWMAFAAASPRATGVIRGQLSRMNIDDPQAVEPTRKKLLDIGQGVLGGIAYLLTEASPLGTCAVPGSSQIEKLIDSALELFESAHSLATSGPSPAERTAAAQAKTMRGLLKVQLGVLDEAANDFDDAGEQALYTAALLEDVLSSEPTASRAKQIKDAILADPSIAEKVFLEKTVELTKEAQATNGSSDNKVRAIQRLMMIRDGISEAVTAERSLPSSLTELSGEIDGTLKQDKVAGLIATYGITL